MRYRAAALTLAIVLAAFAIRDLTARARASAAATERARATARAARAETAESAVALAQILDVHQRRLAAIDRKLGETTQSMIVDSSIRDRRDAVRRLEELRRQRDELRAAIARERVARPPPRPPGSLPRGLRIPQACLDNVLCQE